MSERSWWTVPAENENGNGQDVGAKIDALAAKIDGLCELIVSSASA